MLASSINGGAINYPDYLSLLQNQQSLDALIQDTQRRMQEILSGLGVAQTSDQQVDRLEYDVIWSKGSARLLDYGGNENKPVLFCVPSLINKYTILDLYPKRSVVRYFSEQGFQVIAMDWGTPSKREQNFECADYVYDYAAAALDFLAEEHQAPIHLFGYCMGGIFACALAQLKSKTIDSLTLIATPWNFEKAYTTIPKPDAQTIKTYEQLIDNQSTIPPIWVQSLFHLINPWRTQEAYQRVPMMGSAEQKHFIAVEQWVNDGVPLVPAVAKECLINWPHHNTLYNGQWQVNGRTIDPSRIKTPTLIVAPTDDRIVPLSSSLPLSEIIENSTVIKPESGHISMLVGDKSESQCLSPIHKWLSAHN